MKLAQTKEIGSSVAWHQLLWMRMGSSEINRILNLSMAFSVALVMARVAYTGRLTFMWLIWNLFLAWYPYRISGWLQQRPQVQASKWKFILVSLVWLLFIPNSFYILTDLFHLGKFTNVPNWFDLSLIMSFAWNGLMLGLLSVRQMEKMVQPYLRGLHELLFIYPIMWLSALGVYIGRYPRFNSWDILTNPFELSAYMFRLFYHPLQWKHAWGMVACFSILTTLIYLTIKRLSKAIH